MTSKGSDKVRSELGRWFCERRQQLGLTQEQLAQAVGTSKREIERYEGTTVPRGDTFLLLLSALGLEVVGIPAPKAVNHELLELRAEVLAMRRLLEQRLGAVAGLAVGNATNMAEARGALEELVSGVEERLDVLESQMREREQQ